MIVSINPQKVMRSDALSAYVDYEFYTLRQHTEDLQRIRRKELVAMMVSTDSNKFHHY